MLQVPKQEKKITSDMPRRWDGSIPDAPVEIKAEVLRRMFETKNGEKINVYLECNQGYDEKIDDELFIKLSLEGGYQELEELREKEQDDTPRFRWVLKNYLNSCSLIDDFDDSDEEDKVESIMSSDVGSDDEYNNLDSVLYTEKHTVSEESESESKGVNKVD